MGRRDKKSKDASDEADAGVPHCAGWLYWSAAPGARKPPKEDLDNKIPVDVRRELHLLMAAYRDRIDELQHGLHYKNIGDDIWELRIKRHGNAYRLLFFRWGNYAVALDVFRKTTQRTSKDRAIQRRTTWLSNHGDRPPA